MEKFKFIGWTPCLNGHLDFGLTKVGIKGSFSGDSLVDLKTIEENFSRFPPPDHHARIITLQSKVDWRDSFSEDELIGFFRVFVTARVNNSDDMDKRTLVGNILIYPLENEPDDLEDKKRLSVHNFSHLVKEHKSIDYFNKLDSLILKPSEIQGLKDNNLTCSFNFEVEPSGLTKLNLNESCSALDERSEFIFARQAFYYLKYSVHSHRHHENTHDSLTTIVKYDPLKKKEIALKLVCQLKRELTNLGRLQKIDNKIHPTSNSLGILAYTRSLLISLKRNGYLGDDGLFEEQSKLLDNTERSFESQKEQIDKQEEVINQAKSKSKIWIGFFLAFILGLSRFLLSFSEDYKIEMNQFFAYATPVFIVVFCLGAYQAIITYYKIVEDPSKSRIIYDGKKYIRGAVTSGIMLLTSALVLLTLKALS